MKKFALLLILSACTRPEAPSGEFICLPEGWAFQGVDSRWAALLKKGAPTTPEVFWVQGFGGNPEHLYIEAGADERCPLKNPIRDCSEGCPGGSPKRLDSPQ